MTRVKISLPGVDVKTANIDEEVLDSLYPSPKINTKATPPHAGIITVNWQSSISLPNGTTKLVYSFAHGYDYIPASIASFDFDNGTTRTKGILPLQIGALGMFVCDTDDTNFNLKYFSFDLTSSTLIPPFIIKVRYYIFAERGY